MTRKQQHRYEYIACHLDSVSGRFQGAVGTVANQRPPAPVEEAV